MCDTQKLDAVSNPINLDTTKYSFALKKTLLKLQPFIQNDEFLLLFVSAKRKRNPATLSKFMHYFSS